MLAEELKEALMNGKPVFVDLPMHGRTEFSCVSAVVYRRALNGKIKVSAELLDKNKNAVYYARPRDVHYV